MEDSSWKKYVKSSGFKRKVAEYKSGAYSQHQHHLAENTDQPKDQPEPCFPPEHAACSSTREDNYWKEASLEDEREGLLEENVESEANTEYSPDDISTNFPESLEHFLQRWSVEHRISHSALKPLLMRLSLIDKTLSKDPRRLLGTPRKKPDLIKMTNGEYWHHGLETCLREMFENLASPREIAININVDGLPLFKNGTDQVWPILFNIHGEIHLKPMIIGIFHGKSKPKYVEEFLDPFVTEFERITTEGILINGNLLRVDIRVFICDSPARSFVKGCMNFNGFHGCIKCTAVGSRCPEQKVNTYPQALAPKRTDEGYRNKLYDAHHQKYRYKENGKIKYKFVEKPLLRLNIDLVEDVIVADSLHLLHLGVMKKLLTIYKEGNAYQRKKSNSTVSELNAILLEIELPVEIHRRMRTLEHLCRWKGRESQY